jgi:hypothetical protein
MADFNGTILTTAGLNLLAQAQAGQTLQFTQVVLGSGTWSSTMNPASMTSLVYPSQTVPIQSISVVGDGTARLRFTISNSSLSLGFLLSEIGIYAQTTSSPNTLYAVTYAQNPDFIPASGVTTIEDVIDIYTVVSNAQSVTAVINNSVMLATMQDLYTARPEFSNTAPTDLYPGKIWVSDTQPAEFYNGTTWQLFNAGLLDGYSVGSATNQIPLNNGTLNITLNADMTDGFHASATPTPNTLLPLNSNAVFYNAVATNTISNTFSLTLANNTSYNLTSITVSTPSQPLVDNYKVIFRLTAEGGESASGFNNFQLSVATANKTQVLAPWFWWVPATGIAMGFTDVVIFDQPPNTTVSYTIGCSQWGGSANFVLTGLTTQYAVFPG